MRPLKSLRELQLSVQGEPADSATSAEAARLLSDDRDVEEFVDAWLSKRNHAAFRIDNQMAWTFRALGKPVMVHWTFTTPGGGDTLSMKVYVYKEEREAYEDACRLTLNWILDAEDLEFRELVGWKNDVVMLVRGGDFYSVRTHHSGRIKIVGAEDFQLALKNYVQMVMNLSAEIEFESGDFPGMQENPSYKKVASAFLQRAAGQALQEYGRHCLSLNIDGAAAIEQFGGPELNMSELARSLHTDRPNLTRYKGKSSMAGMTPDRLKSEWAKELTD